MNFSTKQKAIIGLASIVVLILAALFIFMPMWEKNQVKNIEAALASMPGDIKAEKIEVNLLSKSVVLINFSAIINESLVGEEDGQYSIRADKIVLSDLNYSAANENAVVELVDSVEFIGLDVKINEADITQAFSMQTCKINDIRANLFALMDSTKEKNIYTKLKDLATIELGKSSYTDYKYYMDFGFFNVAVHADSGSWGKSSILNNEDMIMVNTTVTFDSNELAKIDLLTIKSVHLPDITTIPEVFNPVSEDQQQISSLQKSLAKLFLDDPLRLDEFKIKGLRAGEKDASVSLDTGTFDLSLTFDETQASYTLNNLELPTALLLNMFPEQAFFFLDYAQPLNLSTDFRFEIKEEDDRIIMSSKEMGLSDPRLGKISWELKLSNAFNKDKSMLVNLADNIDIFFDNFELSLTDQGFLQALTKAMVSDTQEKTQSSQTSNLEDVRTTQAKLLESFIYGNGKNEGRVTLSKNVSEFIRNSGTLDLKVTTQGRTRLDDLERLFRTGEKIKIESSHSK